MNNYELYHHGILGQKWGVRRFQNPDGTWTEAGKRRYGSGAERRQYYKKLNKEAKDRFKKAKRNAKYSTSIKSQKEKLRIAENMYALDKEDIKDSKLYDRLKDRPIPKSQQKSYEEYLKKGMSPEEARVQAYKKDIAKKVMIAAGATAIGVAAVYGVKKYKEYNVDKIIPAGMTMERVTTNDNMGVHDGFYAVLSKNKADRNKYMGLYAKELGNGDNIFQKKMEIVNDLKMPSKKNATAAMKDMLQNNPAIRDEIYKQASALPLIGIDPRSKKIAALADAISGKSNDWDKAYDGFNILYGWQKDDTAGIKKTFNKALSDRGYSAFLDYNDAKFSGYKTKLPVVVANAANVKMSSVRKLEASEQSKALAKSYADLYVKSLPSVVATRAAAIGGLSAAGKAIRSSKHNKVVAEYRKDHPNTNLTYKEIVRNYYERGGK